MIRPAEQTFQRLPFEEQQRHIEAWQRVEDCVISQMPKNSKNFEVHHAVTHARKIYLDNLAVGRSALTCEQITMEQMK